MHLRNIAIAISIGLSYSSISRAAEWPDGFTPIYGTTDSAIELQKRIVFPGFIVLRSLDRWKEPNQDFYTIAAVRLLITCRGDVRSISLSSSTKGYSTALFLLEDDIPSEEIKPLTIQGLSADRSVEAARKESCNLKKSSSSSSVEIPISASDSEINSVVAKTISISGRIREFWLRTRPTKREESELHITLPNGKSLTRTVLDLSRPATISNMIINCRDKTIFTKSITSNRSTQELKSKYSPTSGRAIVPDTVGEGLFEFLCSL